MKRTTTLFAFFLLFAFISHLPSSTLAFIIDIDGEPLQNGGTYYILPVMRGMGGGIELTATGNETCPLTVVQSRSEVSRGLPITISSMILIYYLHEGIPLYISFNAVPPCAHTPSSWTVVKGLPEGPSVKVTGYDNTVSGWFYIKKSFEDYKLVFCPLSTDKCSDIGVHIDDDGNRRLVVTEGNPLSVMFKKVSSSSA